MSDLIQVALPLPLEKTFTYRVPEELLTHARPGGRAVVPFGKRILTGIIVEADADCSAEALREVEDLPDAEPLLPPDLLNLTRWMSSYYFCSWGETLKAALPAGMLKTGGQTIELLTKDFLQSYIPNKIERKILHIIQEKKVRYPSILSQTYRIPQVWRHLRRLEDQGYLKIATSLPRTDITRQIKVIVKPAEFTTQQFIALADELQSRAPHQARILRVIASTQQQWLPKDLLTQAKASRSALQSLLKAGLVSSGTVIQRRFPIMETLSEKDGLPLPYPNPDQSRAIEAISSNLRSGQSETFLLYGVTGSGKTLVYLKVIEQVLELGGSVLVLIPEISLTPQMVGRFHAHFGDKVAVQHSALSLRERTDVWQGIRQGEFPIVIGARSALFAPLSNLKLIVVDEEGDASFKQDEPNPRYQARDMALVRAKMAQAVTVLGSATPSVESFYNAEQNRYKLLELPQRVDNLPPPTIHFSSPPKSRQKALGMELERAIQSRFQRGEQVILLRNRRGFFTWVFCASCGHISRCPHCEIVLTLHRAGQPKPDLRCHLCGYRTAPILTCPKCHKNMRYSGSGTQRLEEELAKILPAEKIGRMDLDTTSGKNAHHRILKSFASEEFALLLGTKMVARGHDYPRVTLVGIISADAELTFPDFRCDERAFVLLLQAAGRAGRSTANQSPGEVILQTWMPNHPVLKLVQAGDFRALYEREKALRRSLNYPPWGWLVLFSFSAKLEKTAQAAARKLFKIVGDRLPQTEWMGPSPAYRARVRDQYRYQVLMKAPREARSPDSSIHVKLEEVIRQVRQDMPGTVHFTVDVDPMQLL